MKKIVISLLLLTSTAVYAEEQQWSGPDFLIIGPLKAGSTSLYNYLIDHPQIEPVIDRPNKELVDKKEIYFFDSHWEKGISWYQSHFPFKTPNDNFLIGEATPLYFVRSHKVPKRVFSLFPKIKLIVLLRNPIDRAFSEFKMFARKKWESRTFEQAVASGAQILKKYQNNSMDPTTPVVEKHREYLIRSLYILHLKRWLQYFPKEQFLILLSDDLLNNPAETVNRVFRFLDLPEYTLDSYPKYFVAPNNDIKMKPETREMLTTLFSPFNQALQDFLTNEFGLDIQLNWN